LPFLAFAPARHLPLLMRVGQAVKPGAGLAVRKALRAVHKAKRPAGARQGSSFWQGARLVEVRNWALLPRHPQPA